MPSLPTRRQQPSPVNPQVPIPGEFPAIPQEITDRFPSAKEWQARLNEFWGRTAQAMQEAQKQTAAQVNSTVIWTVDRFLIYTNEGQSMPMFALDATGVRLGNVLVVNTPGRKIYIGAGTYANANTPFYVDTLGNFSLGDSFVWDAETDTLTITGIINATSGTIGGFEIGADYIRDTGNTFGLSSVVSGSQDVRFWAGDSFANRDTAPVRIYEDGAVFFDTMRAARVTGQGDGAANVVLSITGSVATAASLSLAALTGTFTVGQNASSTYLIFAQNNTVAKSTYTGLTAYGIRFALSSATGTGTIDNAYGIYIDTVNIGTANWGLYVATTARNFMAGDLTVASIGATTPGTGAFTTLSASGNTKLGSGAASNTEILMINRPSGSQTGLQLFQDGIESWTMGMAASVGALNWKYSGNQAMALSSTGLAVTGVVSTTDPAGGAGPNWKLGVAASVSPTAPNRTVRIDIAGTSYYLAAKTTND